MGLAAGYYRGWLDEVLSRIGDIILSFPILVLYVVIIATIGASGINIVLAVTFASAPGIMRIVRGLVLEIRERDYVAAAQMRGESGWYRSEEHTSELQSLMRISSAVFCL